MPTRTLLNWSRLRCLQPNESSDEPYLWAYYWKLDGDTVTQGAPGGSMFSPKVVVHTSPGSHGNLPLSQHPYVVPAAIGQFAADLRPIRVSLGSSTYFVPGQVWCFLALMEEDETGNAAMESAHQEMRSHIESALNGAIAAIPVAAVRNAAAATAPATPLAWSMALSQAFVGLVDQVTNGFGGTLRDKVNDHASDDEDFWNPASWDWDECLGTHVFRMDEVQLRSAPRHDLHLDFISTNSDGTWDSFYTLTGAVEAQAVGTDVIVHRLIGSSTSRRVDGGIVTALENKICLEAGTQVSWELREQVEVEEFLVFAPFTPVSFSIEGATLAPPSGNSSPTRPCRHPRFDLKAPGWVAYDTDTRAVTIAYLVSAAEQSVKLRLQNLPADGLYNVDVSVVAAGVPGAAPLAVETVTFSGQSIFSPSRAGYERCLRDKFGYARFKVPTLVDLWGPSQRAEILEEIMDEATRRAEAGLLSRGRLDTLRSVFARKLRLADRGR